MTVFITGAATGIGAATANAFAAAGFEVALGDLNLDAVERSAKSLPSAVGYEIDVRDRASMERACAAAVDALGPLGVWVSCAGVSSMGRFVDLTDEEIDWHLDVNVRGTLVGCLLYTSRCV